jgi:hypothetical protein
MRRYDVVSGILIILSIVDFALAAPVLVQEKRQASVNVVHTPKDVINVLGKRGDEWLEKFVDDYLKDTENEPSDAHASSDSAPSDSASSELDHGSTNVVQAPALNPHLSEEYFKTWKPPILESSEVHASSSSGPNPHLSEEYFKTWKPPILESSEVHASSSSAPPGSNHGSTNVVQVPAPNPVSSTANPDTLTEPPGPSAAAAAAMQGSWENRFNAGWDDVFSNKGHDGMYMLLRALGLVD